MDGWRRWLLATLLAVVAVGCGQPSPQPPAAATQGPAEHRFVHIHEFPDMASGSPRRPAGHG
jgi:hypothetical protein